MEEGGKMAGRGGRWLLGLSLAVAAASLCWVTAFACTPVATLNLSSLQGAPGRGVGVSGYNFEPVSATGAVRSPVELRWDSLTGPVLARIVPEQDGTLGPIQVSIPADATAGAHMLVALQKGADGQPTARTAATGMFTARAAVEVTSPDMTAISTARGVTSSAGGESYLLVALLAATALTGALLAGLGIRSLVRRPRVSTVRL